MEAGGRFKRGTLPEEIIVRRRVKLIVIYVCLGLGAATVYFTLAGQLLGRITASQHRRCQKVIELTSKQVDQLRAETNVLKAQITAIKTADEGTTRSPEEVAKQQQRLEKLQAELDETTAELERLKRPIQQLKRAIQLDSLVAMDQALEHFDFTIVD